MSESELSAMWPQFRRQIIQLIESGNSRAIESILAQHPELRQNETLFLDCIYTEFCTLEELGKTPKPAEFLSRFPEFEHRLRPLFDVHAAIHQAASEEKSTRFSGSVDESISSTKESQNSFATRSHGADADTNDFTAESSASNDGGLFNLLNRQIDQSATNYSPQDRYELVRPHAEGALGRVWIAKDRELNREVAFKDIKPQQADDNNSRGRFVLEAEITGGLEHPGIVPVYGMGQFKDGRPFYAMRFIRGRSLSEAIQELHQTWANRSIDQTALEQDRQFRNLIQRLIDVSNAVAYAHSRGVLHRDLKPGNIMLGNYGETLVVDWGLARAKGQAMDSTEASASIDREEAFSPKSSGKFANTQMGSTVGTPQFMSPEQAAGQLDLVGPASDVYSLGATLYQILTGQPPIGAQKNRTPQRLTLPEVLRRVEHGEFPPPKTISPAIPAALNAICLKAMALKPSDRYPTCSELANDLELYLADEPVTAFPEPIWKRSSRWIKRHRTLMWSTVVALVTVFIGLIISNAIISRKQAETEAARKNATENFHLANKAVERMLSRVGRDLLNTRMSNVEQVRRELLEEARAFQQQFLTTHPTDAQVRCDLAVSHLRLADIQNWLGRKNDAGKEFLNGIKELESLVNVAGSDSRAAPELARGYLNYGSYLWPEGHLDQGEEFIRKAIALYRTLASKDPSQRLGLAEALATLGESLFRRGTTADIAQAQDLLMEAQELNAALISADPHSTKPRSQQLQSLNVLSSICERANKLDAAQTHVMNAISIAETLVVDEPDRPANVLRLAILRRQLAGIHGKKNELDEAEASFRSVISSMEVLTADFPTVPHYRFELSATQVNLAGLLTAKPGGMDEAINLVYAGKRGISSLCQMAPKNVDYRDALVITTNRLGGLLMSQKRANEAEMVFQEAEAILLAADDRSKETTDYTANLGMMRHNFAEALREQKKFEQAIEYYEQAIKLQSSVLNANSEYAFSRQALSEGFWSIAMCQLGLDDHKAAAASAEKMLPLFPSRWEEPFYVAEILSQCAEKSKDDAAVSKAYVDRAIELIRTAVKHGCNQVDSFRTSPTFAKLRERDEFQSIIESLAK